jgi:NADPH-dependent ferric siderophore reductase
VRLALDGPAPARPVALAQDVATRLRVRGRAVVVVAAADFLRPASVRLEFGRQDPDEFLDSWLDEAGLRREVLEPAGPDGSGRVLPRLWDAAADRAFRDGYTVLPPDGVVLLAGALLLGRGLPVDLAVHLRMSAAALARTLPADERWTLPAYERYDAERRPARAADLLVLADHPARPAVRRAESWRRSCGRGGS